MEEVGIDGGGVFREFLSELIKTAFDPNRGFFMYVCSREYLNFDHIDMVLYFHNVGSRQITNYTQTQLSV